ncbi:flavin reductase family protein [Mycobacterium sp. 852002-51057_SCH5723018]|uniref:flavin reductase family protein n=1 Tax=Mycobacterium sp. 852002-51057_SCH5723018 TaxID=1834094 RepID=UPI0007FE2AC1|nr:flavin reductase family protein [Mycobacterium sp. 852002-51057_SCH5723018]OBG27637.1 oxidoreductase [Mycobacterium sp. 852002-51057_SCH5723018]
MAMLDSPVLVVTTQADDQPSGCLISFATQTSVQPPSFMVVLPRGSGTCVAARRSEHLAVHVLPHHNVALAELFDGETDDEADKFGRCSWRGGPNGMPILDEAIAWFVGRTAHWIDIGDHVAYIVEPVAGWVPESHDDVLYLSDLDDLEPGHEAAERFVLHKPSGEPRKYGLRFTLGGL